ncbi:MAG: hypothetical protein KBS95_00440 [Alistipes sp.]|nr:hypothetical protein [Candidatus Alistipes equi]
MKNFFFAILWVLMPMFVFAAGNDEFSLKNDKISVTVSKDGYLTSLRCLKTDTQYASGGYLWRMYYDAPYQKEIEITAEQQDNVLVSQSENRITIVYDGLKAEGRQLSVKLYLTLVLEQDKVRFSSKVENGEAHTIIREMHYPLLRNVRMDDKYSLFTSEAGGKLYKDPISSIISRSMASPYKTPAQYFRQMDIKYGNLVSMNCFALIGEKGGVYFGSHDTKFQDTWHGLRVYPDQNGIFNRLELGFYKYPHCFCGEKWECDANVIAPYAGSWHAAADIYKQWAMTWWNQRPIPNWVKHLTGWQRVIFKHQYGEYLFKYSDLNGRIRQVGDDVGCNSVFTFGWWEEGMDHGNPDYSEDRSQGGDRAWAKAIKDYQDDNHHIILYYNGKLIDRESRFYKKGYGHKVCRHDNTGSELHEHYKFTGMGTWLGEYDARTFAVANMMNPKWNEVLSSLQDRAYKLGAHAVFFDQLGYIEKQSTNWTLRGEYPVPCTSNIYDRGEVLKLLRARYAEKDKNFALGAEGLTDYLAQFCDFMHMYPLNSTREHFLDFFRYVFPTVIFSDRGLRDDTDVERRVNLNLYNGQINDIEIYRCRDLIDRTPKYQAYLRKANAIKTKYANLLLAGTYNDSFGFKLCSSTLSAHSFICGNRMAIVITNFENGIDKGTLDVPGYTFVEYSALGTPVVGAGGQNVALATNDLVVMIFEKR